MSLELEAEKFLRAPNETTNGAELANRLRAKSVDLQHNKATEFSPDIERLILLAAKVALLTFGSRADEVTSFERDVYYYKIFTPPSPIVAEYDAFKRSL